MTTIAIKDLHKIAGGLNIEGGSPVSLLKTSETQDRKKIWANLVVVLDQPIIKNETFEQLMVIVDNHKYPLLENAVDDLNEHKFLAASLMLIVYYMKNGKTLLRRQGNICISVHVHQDKASYRLVLLLQEYLAAILDIIDFKDASVLVDYRMDNKVYRNEDHHYNDTDILISLSQCAGLDPRFPAGTIIVPQQFIPYNIDANTIDMKGTYVVHNDVIDRLPDILNNIARKEVIIRYVNAKHVSANLSKRNHRVEDLTESDFVVIEILQVDQLWNPTDPDALVQLLV